MSVSSQIIPALDELESQNSQVFDFGNVESFLNETRTSEICEHLGVSADLINRYRDHGLSVFEADAVACKLHQHVSAIWPEWFDIHHIPDDVMDEIEEFRKEFKRCGKCDRWVRMEGGFYRRSASKDGFARFCKRCTKEYDVRKREVERERAVLSS